MLLLILMTGFYVAGEFALIAVDRSRVQQRAEEGDRGAISAVAAVKNLSFHLSGAQLGITITSLLVGFIIEPTVGRALEPLVAALIPGDATLEIATALALVLVTAVQMILSELVPKNLALARPLELATSIATPFTIANNAFRPLILFLNAAANWTVRLVGIEPRDELMGVRSVQELKRLIYSSRKEGMLPEEEFALLTRSINFGNKTASDTLTPRVAVVSIKSDDPLSALTALALDTGHSRFPVAGTGIDDIVGTALLKDVYRFPPEERARHSIEEVMQEAIFVPESRPLQSLLADMRRQRKHLAVVVDEYGGTAGIITLEDMLEEIVGEIDDEYDPEDAPTTLTSPSRGIHSVPGMSHPDEVLEQTGFEMPEAEHYETLAGFLLSLFSRIPSQGDHASHGPWEFKVTEMDGHRIAQVLVVGPPSEDER